MKLKELAIEVKYHIRADFHAVAYPLVFLLAIILLSINYIFDFEHPVIQSYYGTAKGFPVYIIYYLIPYFLAFSIILLIKTKRKSYEIHIYGLIVSFRTTTEILKEVSLSIWAWP